jgi:hypothetical protein
VALLPAIAPAATDTVGAAALAGSAVQASNIVAATAAPRCRGWRNTRGSFIGWRPGESPGSVKHSGVDGSTFRNEPIRTPMQEGFDGDASDRYRGLKSIATEVAPTQV